MKNDNTIRLQRCSNIELFRIITMFFIVAHHYVVNSGLMSSDVIFSNVKSFKSLFLLFFGAWGKTGINCFVLISGYFLCQSDTKIKKVLKLYLTSAFWGVLAIIFFYLIGYGFFDYKGLIKLFFPFFDISSVFFNCFLIFYLFTPFLKALIHNISERMHLYLIILCVLLYTVYPMIPGCNISVNYVTWFIVLYVIASYIRLYPKEIYNNNKIWLVSSLVIMVLSFLSILLFANSDPYKLLQDCNAPLALAASISLFLYFNSLKFGSNKIINTISSVTFDVFCIHACSDTMRKWLWVDTFKNTSYYFSNYWLFHAIFCVVIVYFVCSILGTVKNLILSKVLAK